MSTLNVDAIVSSSGGNTTTINGQTLNADTIVGGRRNIIQNGKFNIDQRHKFASHTVSAGSDFFADRWGFYTDANAFATYGATSEVVSDSPDGFDRSMKWTTTSVTGAGIPATSEVIFRQPVEGYNIAHVNYGSANARDLILSFYVKSSIAGNYGFTAQYTDSGGTNRYIQRSYTVSAANTWERVTVTIPKNTANVMQQKTTGAGLRLNWDLGEGSTYSSAASTTWGTTYTNGLTGGVKIAEVNGATWQITGVQLEVGDVVTPFEHLSYIEDLTICQRYLQVISGGSDAFIFAGKMQGSSSIDATIPLTVSLRASPTMNSINSRTFHDGGYSASSSTAPTALQYANNNIVLAVNCAGFSGLTNNEISNWGPQASELLISAEI